MEVGKQICSFALHQYNDGVYPLPASLLVVFAELTKLCLSVILSRCQRPDCSLMDIWKSIRYIFPSLLYSINNNIYYAGILLVSPPIWIILTSGRIVITIVIYKVNSRIDYFSW